MQNVVARLTFRYWEEPVFCYCYMANAKMFHFAIFLNFYQFVIIWKIIENLFNFLIKQLQITWQKKWCSVTFKIALFHTLGTYFEFYCTLNSKEKWQSFESILNFHANWFFSNNIKKYLHKWSNSSSMPSSPS